MSNKRRLQKHEKLAEEEYYSPPEAILPTQDAVRKLDLFWLSGKAKLSPIQRIGFVCISAPFLLAGVMFTISTYEAVSLRHVSAIGDLFLSGLTLYIGCRGILLAVRAKRA